jgi:hypothetical protein
VRQPISRPRSRAGSRTSAGRGSGRRPATRRRRTGRRSPRVPARAFGGRSTSARGVPAARRRRPSAASPPWWSPAGVFCLRTRRRIVQRFETAGHAPAARSCPASHPRRRSAASPAGAELFQAEVFQHVRPVRGENGCATPRHPSSAMLQLSGSGVGAPRPLRRRRVRRRACCRAVGERLRGSTDYRAVGPSVTHGPARVPTIGARATSVP